MWTKKQIQEHTEVCMILNKIKNAAFSYMRRYSDCSELEVQRFILQQYAAHNLKSALGLPIVAFGSNSAYPHYNPAVSKKIRRLQKGDVVKIDIWARFSGTGKPFGDITWMGYMGTKPSDEIQKVYNKVIQARNASITFLRKELRKGRVPTGIEVDKTAMRVLLKAGYQYRKEILHTTGHSIGTTSPHGRYGGISIRNKRSLKKNLGYTIEPGLYLKGKFGVRSEIDCYIDKNNKLCLTTPIQKELIFLL